MSEEVVKTWKVDITCDASGDGTGYMEKVDCLLYGLHLIKGASSIANTSDVTVTVQGEFPATVLTLANLNITSNAAVYYPRVDSCGNTGSALSLNQTLIPVKGRVRVVVAQGGNGGQVSVSLAGL